MPDVFQVDVDRLNAYLRQEGPRIEWPTPRRILDAAAQGFLAAGVLKASGRPISSIDVDHVGVTAHLPGGRSLYWTDDRIPPLDGLIAALAYHLAAAMNQEPTPGPWPKQLT